MGAVEAGLLAREGASVVIGDVLEPEGERVAADIAGAGGAALFVQHDVTSEKSWSHYVDAALGRFGKVDILVNNAGIVNRGSIVSTSLESWKRTMDVNAAGVFLGLKAVFPAMSQAGRGAIVNIASVSGVSAAKYPDFETMPNAAYYASKGAVRILSKLAAVQFSPHGIRVNTIFPGFIPAPMSEASMQDPVRRAYFQQIIPMPRLGEQEDVAHAVLYLASDEAGFVNGAELTVDGGYLAKS